MEMTPDLWKTYPIAHRARIGAAYILDMKRNRVRDAMSNNAAVAIAAQDELLEVWRKLISCFACPNLWTVNACKAALQMPWQVAIAPFATAFMMMGPGSRKALQERGEEFMAQHLAGVHAGDILGGAK